MYKLIVSVGNLQGGGRGMYPEDVEIRSKIIGADFKIRLYDSKLVNVINFDNAATTPAFKRSWKYLSDFLPVYGSIARGAGYKSQLSTEMFENSRKKVLKFFSLGNRQDYEVIYVKNTTEGINKLANRLITSKDELVITTRMEHHSNDLPWRGKCRLEYVDVNKNGEVPLEAIEKKLAENKDKFSYFTITGASNVTGFVNPVNQIAKLVHENGGEIIVDGAQLVPHRKVNMAGAEKGEEIDYMVFSAHKIYAPFGIGVIIAKKDKLALGEPDLKGGGTVVTVTDDEVVWKGLEAKEEAGTQNLLGVVALLGALEEIDSIGYDTIVRRENVLMKNLFRGLKCIKGINIYGMADSSKDKLGIGVFNLKELSHGSVASLLSKLSAISVRNGCFCAQPYVQRLLGTIRRDPDKFGMVRVSFGVYNTLEELWVFLNTLEYISKHYDHKL
ncbi:MAG: aminotransferase class V-fold PLP-dependent enzyme [Clostridiaceae bacterium]